MLGGKMLVNHLRAISIIIVLHSLIIAGCGGSSGWEENSSSSSSSSSTSSSSTSSSSSSSSSSGSVEPTCTRSEVETQMSTILSNLEVDTDFAFYVEASDGDNFSYSHDSVTMDIRIGIRVQVGDGSNYFGPC
jgi:hypothetical protein